MAACIRTPGGGMSDWRKDLLERYEPSICPSIDCGDGWRPLIEYLYNEVDKYDCIFVEQVKEKFAGLRFYISHQYDCPNEDCDACNKIYPNVNTIESLSRNMCEQCGSYISSPSTNGGWLRAECGPCAADRILRHTA
jgi:hypothetical protein